LFFPSAGFGSTGLGGKKNKGDAVAIYRLLRERAFDPDAIEVMTFAFEDVCRELGLAQREDPLRDIVAKAIIECAEAGERDPTKLRECAQDVLQA
jgi:hypothetical protein